MGASQQVSTLVVFVAGKAAPALSRGKEEVADTVRLVVMVEGKDLDSVFKEAETRPQLQMRGCERGGENKVWT